jgi:Mn-dependent DtxR family transcriptional regulator
MMKRDRDIQVNLERPIYILTVDLARKLEVSASSLIRQLIINELRDRGLISDRQLAEMALAR